MSDELLAKKLGLYYHPLFRTIVQEWASAFQASKNPIDIITFLEINVRIQQAILPHTDPDNSLASALHDWNREVTNLSLSDTPSPSTPTKIKENDILKILEKALEDYPLELAYPVETYMFFFNQQIERLRYSLVVDKLSIDGFAKFVFDLCYSWCGTLDMELFSFFLMAVFYQTVQFRPLGYFQVRPFDEITSFPEPLLTQIRLVKAHYNRYKKVDLISFESWYEWNYLPHRLKEIKAKISEVFCSIFKGDENIGNYLDGLYWKSIQEITQKNLTKPSMTHFKVFSKENVEPGDTTSPQNGVSGPVTIKYGVQRALLQLKSYNPLTKKTIVPVLGRMVPKSEQMEPERIEKAEKTEKVGTVHTLKSIEPFLGDLDPIVQEDPLQKQNHLYPIWEREASETTTIMTRGSVDKENMFKINKGVRTVSREKIRHGSNGGPVRRDYDEKVNRGNNGVKGYVTVENVNYNSVGFVKGKGRTSISPRIIKPQIMSPTWAPKMSSETPSGTKVTMFGEKDSGKGNRTPISLMKKRPTLSHTGSMVSLWSETAEDISTGYRKREVTDKKLLGLFGPTMEGIYRSSTGPKSRQKSRVSKETSPELNRPYREEKVELTVVGKSRVQGGDEDLLYSSRDKYGLNLLAIEVDEGEKIKERVWSKTPKIDLGQRAQSTRGTRSPSREAGSPGIKQRTSRGVEKRTGMDPYMHMTIEIRKDSYSNIRLQFPSSTTTVGSRRGSKVVKQEGMVGKNLKEMFEKMKDREEKNKRKQDIRMKRVKRPESKQGSQGMSQVGMESRKGESVLTEIGKALHENIV